MQNLKVAFRSLRKTPFVTVIAVVSLALGIGANAAIYSSFYQMLLRPVPAVPNADDLVKLGAPGPKPGSTSCNDADPVVIVSSVLVLTVVALSAGFVPAVRASRIDPMQALRYE